MLLRLHVKPLDSRAHRTALDTASDQTHIIRAHHSNVSLCAFRIAYTQLCANYEKLSVNVLEYVANGRQKLLTYDMLVNGYVEYSQQIESFAETRGWEIQ